MPPGAKSMDNYHAITPFYRDFCPPIISLVKKPSQWEITSLRVSLFSSLLLYMEGKQNIFIVSIGRDIKNLSQMLCKEQKSQQHLLSTHNMKIHGRLIK